VADGGAALGISGNLNRVYGNSTLEGCISSSGFGNIIEGNFEDPEFCPELGETPAAGAGPDFQPGDLAEAQAGDRCTIDLIGWFR
jgi:hypothetical protein